MSRTSSLRIAVADDEPVMLMFLEEVLQEAGHQVVASVKDGGELVERCKRERPDLVLTDVKLLGMSGLEAVREICRERPLPVVFFTGLNNVHDASDTVAGCGVFVYVVKPVGAADIEAAITLAADKFTQFQVLAQAEASPLGVQTKWQQVEAALAQLRKQRDLRESEAFEHLRSLALKWHVSLPDAAERFLAQPPG